MRPRSMRSDTRKRFAKKKVKSSLNPMQQPLNAVNASSLETSKKNKRIGLLVGVGIAVILIVIIAAYIISIRSRGNTTAITERYQQRVQQPHIYQQPPVLQQQQQYNDGVGRYVSINVPANVLAQLQQQPPAGLTSPPSIIK